MPKPTVLPEWNSDGSNRTTPSGAQQDSGWAVDQVPPSSYFNWWMYYVYAWIQWIATRTVAFTPVPIITSATTDWVSRAYGVDNEPGIESQGTGEAVIDIGVHCVNGDGLEKIEFDMVGNGSTDLTLDFWYYPNDGTTRSSIATTTITNPGTSRASNQLSFSPSILINHNANGGRYLLFFTASNTGITIFNMRVFLGAPP